MFECTLSYDGNSDTNALEHRYGGRVLMLHFREKVEECMGLMRRNLSRLQSYAHDRG